MKSPKVITLSLALTALAPVAHAQFNGGGGYGGQNGFGGQGGNGGQNRSRTPATPPAPPTAWAKFGLNPKVRVNLDFRNASVDAVLHMLSQASGVAIIKDPALIGGITLQSPKPQSLNQAFTILNAVLNLKNYEITSEGNFLLVRPRQQASPRAAGGAGGFGGRFGGGGFGQRSQSEIRTYVLRYADATALARVINDVYATTATGPNAGAFAFPVAGGNPAGGNTTVIVPQGGNGGQAGNTAQGGFGGRRGGRRGGFGQGGFGGGVGGGSTDGTTAPVKASADAYSNSLIINASPTQQAQIADIIDQIDQPTPNPEQAQVFRLNYALAADLQPVIQNILSGSSTLGRGSSATQNRGGGGGGNRGGFGGGGFGGGFAALFGRGGGGGGNNANGTVTADERTNTLVVTATPANLQQVAQVIATLDKPATYVGSTFVYVMKNARADVVANLLNQSFGNRTTNGPTGGSLTNPTFSSGTLATGSGSAPSGLSTNTLQRNTASNNATVTAGQQNQTPATTGIDSQGRVINIRNLTGQVLLVPNIDTNSIIVVAPPEDRELLESILETMDQIPEQVMIETLVVETNLTKANQLGVEFNIGGLGGGFGQDFGLGLAHPLTPSTTQLPPPSGLKYTLSTGQYHAVVQALRTDTAFNVLSTPRIFTTNNATAQINVSQSLPYTASTTQNDASTTNSVNFLDVGIVLTVTPRITSDGYVTMDVTQTANDFVGYSPTANGAPIVNQRETQTTASVKDGETVVLGGLISNSYNRTVNKVPILGDIPLIGSLFRSTSTSKDKTELLVFMTPHVIRGPQDAQRIRQQTELELGKTAHEMLPTATPAPTPAPASPGAVAPANVAPIPPTTPPPTAPATAPAAPVVTTPTNPTPTVPVAPTP